jgi:cytochrome c oxidase subunit 1
MILRRLFTREGLFTTEHRAIGYGYLAVSAVAVLVGVLLSLLMRLHLTWPQWSLPLHGAVLPEEYLALVTMHGTLMLFFVLTVAPQAGFGNLMLPAQIGSQRMAFPVLNALAMWLTAAALLVLLCSRFVPGGSSIGGWTAYPPLSTTVLAGPGQGLGMDLWLTSIGLFAIASTMSAVNLLTTIVKLRCEGMVWHRMPLTVWGWFTAALLSLIAFSVLLAAIVLLQCDRHAGTSFFLPAGDVINGVMLRAAGPEQHDGSPLLWLHLFWFFGHPEVYIAILPGMGLVSMVLANFARRPVFAYRLMIATTLLIGWLGILVWGHHMFVAGLNPFAGTAFEISTMAIALPASAKVLSWLATVWGSKPRLTTPMLFALGFVSFFITGGLSGPILAQPILDQYLHNTFFVVAHLHLIMAMAGVFGLFCAVYYWMPLLCGHTMNERLGRWHFWLTVLAAYGTFLPMHLTGLAGEPRHYAQLRAGSSAFPMPADTLLAKTSAAQVHITISALLLAAAQLVFFINLWRTLRSNAPREDNPWQATTLEWAPGVWCGEFDQDALEVFVAPCEYALDAAGFHPQWQPMDAGERSDRAHTETHIPAAPE